MPVRTFRPIKLMLHVALAAGLVWLVVTRSFVAYLADINPAAALRLNSSDAESLINLAERMFAKFEASPDDGDEKKDGFASRLPEFAAAAITKAGSQISAPPPDASSPTALEAKPTLSEIRVLAERALANEPLNPRALTLLGRIAELSEPPAQAAKTALPYYALAARLSPRASTAVYWLMRHSIEELDYVGAVKHADTLLRTRTQAGPAVFPYLGRLAELPAAKDTVKDLLATDPPWRSQFLAALPAHITDARTPLELLLHLKQTASPPSPNELRSYLNFLTGRNFFQLAYYTWLQFLPPEQLESIGLIFNGGFGAKPSGSPFDWAISGGSGTTAELVPVPGEPGQQALRIDFTDGRVQFGGVAQTVFLAPGEHTLSGRHRGELVGKRGLRWRIRCLPPASRQLAETEMHLGLIPAWQEFRLSFVVPATDCETQQIRLDLDARSTSERLVRGTMWYDDIVLKRVRSQGAIQ